MRGGKLKRGVMALGIGSLLNPGLLKSIKEKEKVAVEKSKRLAAAEGIKEWMINIRNQIHKNPELTFDCYETSKLVKATLKELDVYFYDDKTYATTGVVGRIGSGSAPFVALRADMDALPLQELYEWEHKSKVDGVMHACGHDAHTSMLLGAAKLLQQRYRNKEFEGTVFLLFQPSEEKNAGASEMVADGALKESQAIFGLHVTDGLPVGMWASRVGTLMAGSTRFDARINGVGGHGGVPQGAIDPIVASASIISSLQPIVSRETDPNDSQVITVGYVNGGTAGNIIPDFVEMGGTFRYVDGSDEAKVEERKNRILQVIEDQAVVHRCTATSEFNPKHNYPPVVNSSEAYEFVRAVALKVLGDESKLIELPSSATASEDFSYYLKKIPGAFGFVGCAASFPNEDTVYPVHNPKFVLDEDVLPVGAAILTATAIEYIANQPF
ncbi:hypothetical protein GOP47_0024366 [Adiantum capillus-veneris]|uniref:Peptidase M20 dimerisation domain-containing protein n=1 Tax=Adiantum capillus-veneris TaxID=13818 RepID=A0A9D4U1L0_ADICA|nr:hypothetical protein GOP47_0024366 [Adiantum capillus-veneris]